jgi:hypothetical protein
MLKFLRGKASKRKRRLYLCGGARHIAHLFYLPDSLIAVEVAERYVDGQATAAELAKAEWDAEIPTFGYDLNYSWWGHDPDTRRLVLVPRLVEMGVLRESALAGGDWQVDDAVRRQLTSAAELAECCAMRTLNMAAQWFKMHVHRVDWPGRWLIDCIFGDPFRIAPAGDPSLVAWNDGIVRRLAQFAYDERALPSGRLCSDRLAVLADALEDAGCSDARLLGHLRGPGPHCRGCWVVDLLLGKS